MNLRSLLATFAATALCACAGGKSEAAHQSKCAAPTEALVVEAIAPYVHSLEPQPVRFLYNEGADSSLGPLAAEALKAIGPTWLLPADAPNQGHLRSLLKSGGSYVTLFVARGSVKTVDDSTAAVPLRGTYMWFGDKAGKPAAQKDILFACRAYNWALKDSTSAPKAQ